MKKKSGKSKIKLLRYETLKWVDTKTLKIKYGIRVRYAKIRVRCAKNGEKLWAYVADNSKLLLFKDARKAKAKVDALNAELKKTAKAELKTLQPKHSARGKQ